MSRLSASRRRRDRDESRAAADQSLRGGRREPPGRGSIIGVVAVGSLLVLAMMALGRDPQGEKTGRFQLSGSPEQLLIGLAQRYQEIRSYEDRTLMQLQAPQQARWPGDRADVLVRFVRPNKIRLQVSRGTNQLLLTCDGGQLHTQLLDETTRNFDDQVIQRPAPDELTLGALFSATEIAEIDQPDQLVSALMSLPCPLVVSQLALLLDPGCMPGLIESASQINRLADATFAGRPCVRVQLVTENGGFTFWIDQQEGLLRRIEYPPPRSRSTTDPALTEADSAAAAGAELARAVVTADLDNVRTNAAFPPSNFRQQPPPETKLVQHFIVPPLHETADVLGKRVSGFTFTDVRGEQFGYDQLRAPIRLLVWFNNRAPSYAVLQKLSKLDQDLRSQRKADVQLLGVCTEPSTVMSHAQVQQLADQWDIPFPVVRDLEAHGRDIFGISQAPTIVLIDDHDIVQLLEVGGSSNLDQELPVVFEKLMRGEPLAQQYLDFLAERQRAYRQLLAAASVNAPPPVEPTAPTRTRNPTDPAQLVVQALWTSELLPRPGNLTVDHSAAVPCVLVNDGWHHIHEYDFDGSRLDTHALGRDVTAADLRCQFGRGGLRATISELARRISVFDERWLPLFEYPESNLRHNGVQDALVEDLDGDGQAELYVAFAGQEGVHRVDADGRRAWREASITDALALCSSHDRTGQRFLLVTRQGGDVTPISAAGTLNQSVPTRPLHRLISNPRLSEDASFCGVSRALDGRRLIVGLDKRFEESWTHTTPAGMFRRQTRMIAWAPWAGLNEAIHDGCWLIADQQGSVHVVSEDGSFQDNFSFGTPVHGIAAARHGERNLLFLSTHDTVRAWQVSTR